MHLVPIGGRDAGISAPLWARELDPGCEVTVVADAYPNFSICGIPYYVSGEVTHWRNLAHRSIADLETGMGLRLAWGPLDLATACICCTQSAAAPTAARSTPPAPPG
jgi:NADPH-dependent 2,4-dienoyl-CoA reductase/sulfur reductase-like enzyme